MVNQVPIVTTLLLLCAGMAPAAGQAARSAVPKKAHHLGHAPRHFSQRPLAQNSPLEAEVTALQSALSARQGRQKGFAEQGRQEAFKGIYPGWKITLLRQRQHAQ